MLLIFNRYFVKTASQQTVEQFVVLSFINCLVIISQKSSPHSSYKYTKIDLFTEHLVGITLFLTVASLKSPNLIRYILSFPLLPMDGACSKSPCWQLNRVLFYEEMG